MPSPKREGGHACSPDSSFRDEYLERHRQLVTDLTKCHDELTMMRTLVEALPSVCQLSRTFSFQEALSFDARQPRLPGEPALDALKRIIATKVQEYAAKGDLICRAPQDRQAYFDRLERQFHDIQRILIEQERARCGEKVGSLCARIEQVVGQLESFPDRPDRFSKLLGLMALSLRQYAQGSLGQPSILLRSDKEVEISGRDTPADMPLEVFFDLLDNLAVDTLTKVLELNQNQVARN